MTDQATPTLKPCTDAIEVMQADIDAAMILLWESWIDNPIDDVFARAFARHRLDATAAQAAALTATAEAAATHLNAKIAADAEITRLREALEGLVDDEPCWKDHHGYCQAHGLNDPCEMAIARAALSAQTSEQDQQP